LCPKCIKLRDWCDNSKVDEGAAQAYDLTLQIVDAETVRDDVDRNWLGGESPVQRVGVPCPNEAVDILHP